MKRRLLLAGASVLAANKAVALPRGHASNNAPTPPTGNYIDPAFQTSIPFGAHSPWIQPWRGYLETKPVTTFVNGIGIVSNIDYSQNAAVIYEMLSRNGIKHVRLEVGWGNLDYTTGNMMSDANSARLDAELAAALARGIRPLILLNANDGLPCPATSQTLTVTANASIGATSITLSSVAGLVAKKSGLPNGGTLADVMFVSFAGNVATLSKPLPFAISSGASVTVTTLKYQPFSQPATSEYVETIAGWQAYVGVVAAYITGKLGTGAASDKGFDLEVWNELTFGSRFLDINNYYEPDIYTYDNTLIWANLVQATVDYVNAHSSAFQGVALSDGFSNTIPWPASSTEPARVTALNKHPYPPLVVLPADEQAGDSINALMTTDAAASPAYTAYFPEYSGTAIQTEHIIRDLSPIPTDVYGTQHGRTARTPPVSVMLTEINLYPAAVLVGDPTAARLMKAKGAARFFTFFLNKGCSRVYLFSTNGGDVNYGILLDSFITYAEANSTYPVSDGVYISPALTMIKNLVAKFSLNVDANLTPTQITLNSVTDSHNHKQFTGSGTAAHPDLFDRDVFAFLPFQADAAHYVIPYYVMTRDIRTALTPEAFTIQVSGLPFTPTSVTAYDPLNDTTVAVSGFVPGTSWFTATVTAADYPYLLLVQ